jgi:NodT family efflux transporter outer membrane factor (OMF) lipoprotein
MTANLVSRTATVVTALLLAACSTPRLPSQPDTPLPERWQATLPHGGDVQALADWWRRFDDALLPELVAQAQASSPSLAQAVARIGQARAGLQSAQAQRWPGVTLNAQAQRGAGAATNFIASSQASVVADAQWEIDLFGATRAQVAAAQARSEQAQLGWHSARVSLAADVAQTYVGLRSCEAQRGVFDEDARSQQQSAGLTREKVRVGFESPANGALADGAAADAGNRAIAQRADCEVLLQSLSVLSGRAVAELRTRLAARSGQLPQPAAFSVVTLPIQLLAQRPDIAAAEREVVAAAAEVGVADAARYPRLTFNGSIGLASLRAGGTTNDGSSWGFGPALSLPLFDAGQRAANRDAAMARYDEARAALDGRLRTAVGEVEEALLRLDSANRREADALRAAQGFRDYFAAAEARWRSGAGSLIDREDARRIALNAQSALLTVQRERVASWVTLYRALGGGWSAGDGVPALTTK